MKQRLLQAGIPLLGVLVACGDSTVGNVSLALTSRAGAGAGLAPSAAAVSWTPAPTAIAEGDSTVIALGNDTIVLRSVELVLREVELERVETLDCDVSMSTDDCEKFATGPVLVSVPLGATATATQVSITAGAGMFNELEFEIHKPDELNDAAFIAAHPAFADVSIRVTGTYSQAGARSDFTYMSDLNEDQEIFLDPPLTIVDGDETTVTLRLDVSRWFVNGAGDALLDPATANKGAPNENVVRDNIRASIDAFRDDDRDGHDDDNEVT
ncbi:MAG: hypothetical protein ACREMN_04000 [Gemmatimonadales bacterium]